MTSNKIDNSKQSLKTFLKSGMLFDTAFTIVIFLVMLLIISNPATFTSGTIEGLKLFFFKVFPGLFPFMILTKLLTELGVLFRFTSKFDRFSRKVFGTPGVSLYCFLMSIVSGYPIGAKIIGDLHEKRLISDEDARKMSVFCTTSGPIFVIGTVGLFMFKNYTLGLILYACHIISSILLGIIFNLVSRKKREKSPTAPVIEFVKKENIVTECVNSTINSLFVVGAYITMFYLVTELLESLHLFDAITNVASPLLIKLHLDPKYLNGVLYGILEVTRGTQELSLISGNASLVLAAGILSFSGLSIIMQSMAFLKNTKIKARNFILTKMLHAILATVICWILVSII